MVADPSILTGRVARKRDSDKGESKAKIHSSDARARSLRGKPVYVDQETQVSGRYFSNIARLFDESVVPGFSSQRYRF